MLNAAFIFIAPEADPETHRATVKTPEITLTSIGVSTFEEGAAAAKEMVDKGCTAIVHGRARVGSVRFDIHPGLDNKSGDEVFI